MNAILKNTHKKENINLLKARDYYFDIARKYNVLKIGIVCLPSIMLIITYIPYIAKISWIENRRDYIIGLISIIVFIFVQFKIKNVIDKNLYISNAFREKYDCTVFEIAENPFEYTLDNYSQYMEKAKKVRDYDLYEVWYGEIFCDKKGRNIICCQMDNIIYTYFIYRAYRKFSILIPVLLFILTSLFFMFYGKNVGFLVFISIFNILQMYIESIDDTSKLIKNNLEIMGSAEEESSQIIKALDNEDTAIIRMLQDRILNNRNQSLFVPKFIRNKYLKAGSVYRRELDKYREIYFDKKSIKIPDSAKEIEIYNLEENNTVALEQIQQRLLSMMEKVLTIFEEEKIIYTLDGGTLIGAVRSRDIYNPIDKAQSRNGKFLFWDDDIDIALPIEMLEQAKKVIIEKLGDEFDVQDYDSETYYSPRLANFRIRDKKSKTSEKDSNLYDLYKYRGLFIDVYAFSPIFCNRILDSCYRHIFIYPLHQKMIKTENKYKEYHNEASKPADNTEFSKILRKFIHQKSKYLRRVKWYNSHSKNKTYLTYSPNYINNLKATGPYIKREYLYGEYRTAKFETLEMPIPSSPEMVLSAFYNEWYISPYKPIEFLQAKYGDNWYSHNDFKVSIMKHIDHVDLYDI